MTVVDEIATPDAEASILSAALLGGETALAAIASTGLVADDFVDVRFRELYAAMLRVGPAGCDDVALLVEDLKAAGRYETTGGHAMLAWLADQAPDIPNVDRYSEILFRRSMRRRLAGLGQRMTGISQSTDLDAAVEYIRAQVADLLGRSSARAVQAGEGIDATIEAILSCSKGTNALGIPTYLPGIDRALQSLPRGETAILAARPGVGKSLVALAMAAAAARDGLNVLVASLEMTVAQMQNRLIAAATGFPLDRLISGWAQESDRDRFSLVAAEILSLPLYFDDTPRQRVADIEARANSIRVAHGGIDLIVVDYLQLLSEPTPGTSRYDAVSTNSRDLKILAKSLDVPVLVLSQLNRQPADRTDGKPRLSDLRESGAIEQDAAVVATLHWIDGERDNGVEFAVLKNRSGPTRTARLDVDYPCQRITEVQS